MVLDFLAVLLETSHPDASASLLLALAESVAGAGELAMRQLFMFTRVIGRYFLLRVGVGMTTGLWLLGREKG